MQSAKRQGGLFSFFGRLFGEKNTNVTVSSGRPTHSSQLRPMRDSEKEAYARFEELEKLLVQSVVDSDIGSFCFKAIAQLEGKNLKGKALEQRINEIKLAFLTEFSKAHEYRKIIAQEEAEKAKAKLDFDQEEEVLDQDIPKSKAPEFFTAKDQIGKLRQELAEAIFSLLTGIEESYGKYLFLHIYSHKRKDFAKLGAEIYQHVHGEKLNDEVKLSTGSLRTFLHTTLRTIQYLLKKDGRSSTALKKLILAFNQIGILGNIESPSDNASEASAASTLDGISTYSASTLRTASYAGSFTSEAMSSGADASTIAETPRTQTAHAVSIVFENIASQIPSLVLQLLQQARMTRTYYASCAKNVDRKELPQRFESIFLKLMQYQSAIAKNTASPLPGELKDEKNAFLVTTLHQIINAFKTGTENYLQKSLAANRKATLEKARDAFNTEYGLKLETLTEDKLKIFFKSISGAIGHLIPILENQEYPDNHPLDQGQLVEHRQAIDTLLKEAFAAIGVNDLQSITLDRGLKPQGGAAAKST